ncbi:MAG: thymidylate synthase (FAD), partial [Deltaproteobacteria bacterium]|nr:thymidylate synthase (FAD) [Deltaproteobacteria bacterium]
LGLVEASEPFVAELHPSMTATDRRKIIRQSARSVLPNACETKVFITANARALRHFFEMRGSLHADAEIRELAVTMCRLIKEESPNIMADVNVVLEDGIETVAVVHSKV